MKILSLNTWKGGFLREEVSAFITRQAFSIDVFCFQEVGVAFKPIADLLMDDFVNVYAEKSLSGDDYLRQATFVRRGLPICESGTILEDVSGTGLGLWVSVQSKTGLRFICNYHGNPQPGSKMDDHERLSASRALITHAQSRPEPQIVIGDFNLNEATESVGLFEVSGFSNLIQKNAIQTTRNEYAWALYPGEKQYHADYAFVSRNAEVVSFAVLPDIVSDHQPLFLEIQ